MQNVDFLRALGEGHSGRFWVTGFSADPNQANGNHWRGHLVRRSSEIPSGETNSYFATGLLRDNAPTRNKDSCTAVVAVVLDDIAPEDIPDDPAPTWVLETSPHNYQVGFALQPGQPQGAVDALIRGLTRAGYRAADKSGNNIIRYVRLPCGVNTKEAVILDHGEPFRCRLDAFEPSRRFSVQQLIQAFSIAVAPEATLEGDHTSDEVLMRQITDCEAFHTPLVQLAARLIGRGMQPQQVVADLERLMDQAAVNLDDSKRRGEWQQRRVSVPRYVQSAQEKYVDPITGLKIPAAPSEWPEVEPLGVGFTEPLPFPVQAFPQIIRDAVSSYAEYGKQPIAMIASSALATVSLVCQGHADIARDDRLRGPISLFVLPVGVSGERKTAVDKTFTAPLRKAIKELQDEAQETIRQAKARHRTWTAQTRGIEKALAGLEEGRLPVLDKPKGGPVTEAMIEQSRARLKARAQALASEEPVVPTIPQLLYSDTTIEGLAVKLQRGLPIGALWEDEGGVTLGSVGLKEDRVLGFLTSFSKLWDASGWSQHRASVDDRDLSGKRVTINLMMQPSVVAGLAGFAKGCARTTGFLARFLICEPQSTMGTRLYSKPGNLAAVDAFTQRVLALFCRTLPYAEGDEFSLDPPVLHLTPEAFTIWQEYHDEVEVELRESGDLVDIPDFASKSAEQACRIAGCLHLFAGCDVDELVTGETMQSAKAIAEWYLLETLRVTNLRAVPEPIADAMLLWEWVAARDEKTFTAGDAARKGPYRLRSAKERRDRALDELTKHGYVVLQVKGNNARTFQINPNAEAGHVDSA